MKGCKRSQQRWSWEARQEIEFLTSLFLDEKQLQAFSRASLHPRTYLCHRPLSITVVFLPLCLRRSAHNGVVQFAGRDTLTIISARTHAPTHTHT